MTISDLMLVCPFVSNSSQSSVFHYINKNRDLINAVLGEAKPVAKYTQFNTTMP